MPFYDELTPRERQVLALVVQGLSNKRIAGRLSIAESTVENHLHHIYQKLNVATRTEAAVLAVRAGIIINEKGGNPS